MDDGKEEGNVAPYC